MKKRSSITVWVPVLGPLCAIIGIKISREVSADGAEPLRVDEGSIDPARVKRTLDIASRCRGKLTRIVGTFQRMAGGMARSCGVSLPEASTIVTVEPAGNRISGRSCELAIALADEFLQPGLRRPMGLQLLATGQVRDDGAVEAVAGFKQKVRMAVGSANPGLLFFVPRANVQQACEETLSLLSEMRERKAQVVEVDHLAEVRDAVRSACGATDETPCDAFVRWISSRTRTLRQPPVQPALEDDLPAGFEIACEEEGGGDDWQRLVTAIRAEADPDEDYVFFRVRAKRVLGNAVRTNP